MYLWIWIGTYSCVYICLYPRICMCVFMYVYVWFLDLFRYCPCPSICLFFRETKQMWRQYWDLVSKWIWENRTKNKVPTQLFEKINAIFIIIHVYMCIFICICICVCIIWYIGTDRMWMHTYIYMYTHIYMHIYTDMIGTCICILVRIFMPIHCTGHRISSLCIYLHCIHRLRLNFYKIMMQFICINSPLFCKNRMIIKIALYTQQRSLWCATN